MLAPETATPRTNTGLPILDERLGGGFDRPCVLLFFSRTPAEKRLFAEHFVMTGLGAGESCLYVDFFRAPQLILRELSKFGPVEGKPITFVDATSAQLLIESGERHVIHDLDDLVEITRTICYAIRETRPSRVVIDSMEFLADRFDREAVFCAWKEIADTAKECGSAAAFLFINWTYADAEMRRVLELSDYVVEFQTRVRTGVMRNYLRIARQGDGGFQTAWIPYTFQDVSGLKVYFPRILVIGPPDAGKSTVVRALCGNSVSVDKMGTTVAFDYGNLAMAGLEAEVIGTPGQERFEFIFSIFAREVSGILLVVDRSRPGDIPRAKALLALLGPETPLVVLANKGDLPGSMDLTQVREALGVGAEVPVVATVATNSDGTREGLLALAQRIIGV